jgi:hypothetical protein
MEAINPHPWRTSTYSSGNGGNCVEIGQTPGSVLVRDTKQEDRADRPTLAVPASAWQRFTDSLKS